MLQAFCCPDSSLQDGKHGWNTACTILLNANLLILEGSNSVTTFVVLPKSWRIACWSASEPFQCLGTEELEVGQADVQLWCVTVNTWHSQSPYKLVPCRLMSMTCQCMLAAGCATMSAILRAEVQIHRHSVPACALERDNKEGHASRIWALLGKPTPSRHQCASKLHVPGQNLQAQ